VHVHLVLSNGEVSAEKSVRKLTTVAIGLFSSVLGMATPALAASDPAATVDAFHAALHEGKADAALALLATNVSIFETGFVEQSRDAYRGAHLDADLDFARKTQFAVVERNLMWLGASAACVMSRTTTKGDFQGHPVDLIGTETMLLQKAGDGWVISHIHWSAHPREQGADQ
jgi:ketosteroid isomerase-like protein